MKNILIFLLALSAGYTTTAQGSRRSMLKIRLSDRSAIAVNIDGRYIDRQTTALTLDGLKAGWHRVEVYNTEAGRRRPLRMYTGTIRLRPGTVNIAIVDVNRRSLRLRSRPLDVAAGAQYPGNEDRNGFAPRRPADDTRKKRSSQDQDDAYRDEDPPKSNTDKVEGNEGFGSFPRGRGNTANRPQDGSKGLSRAELDALGTRVRQTVTDTEREKLLKTELEGRRVKTSEVRKIMSWLAFESTRLEFARWAYARTSDPEHYAELEKEFEYQESKKDFKSFIRANR